MTLTRFSFLAGTIVTALTLPILAQQAAPVTKPAERKEPNKGGEIDVSSADPKVALERFKLQDGYQINLFASEKEFPELAKPVSFNFDERGRCWVTTMPSYPHYLPGEAPHDKILILEDTDHDGKADKCTTFADDLYLPAGFELGDGGVYVGQQPFIAFLKDTDGDGKADQRSYNLHGFGTEDSHHAVHTFTWGPDGGLYFQEGTFFNTQVETPYGRVQLKDGGIFRFDALRQHLGIFVSYGFANPWGHYFDKWGTNFIADASGGANYFGSAITGDVDFPYKHPNMKVFTSIVRPTAGCELVSSRQFPDSAQGNFLLNNTIGFQGIKQHQIMEYGSGYTSKEIEPLLQSSDPNFRPVGLRFGPDGALYVVDWWNPLVGHMQYSLRDPRRDKQHGRIWRITAKDRPLVAPPKIAGATVAEKLDLLKAYEDRTRYRVRVSLREHPVADVQKGLTTWIAALDKSDANYEHNLLEAFWVSQTIGEPDLALLKQLLNARDYHIRSGATRAVRFCLERATGQAILSEEDALGLLRARVADEAPRVRLEALLTLSYIRQPAAAALALETLKQSSDYYLDYVLQETITTLEPDWKSVLFSGKELVENNPAGAAYLLARLSTPDLVSLAKTAGTKSTFSTVLRRGGVSADDRKATLAKLAQLNRSTELSELLLALEGAQGDARKELVSLLTEWPVADLSKVRDRLEQLATRDAEPATRQAGWIALLRADGTPDRAWSTAAQSPSSLGDLLDSTALVKDEKLLGSLYPKIQPLLTSLAASSSEEAPTVIGRFVRVEHPAESRTLALAEVQVFSLGENIAPKGIARQSTTAFGGTADRAIDGRTDGAYTAGTSSHTQEMENYPWWEVDLGSEQPIDKIVLWNRTDGLLWKRLANSRVAVLDAQRRRVFEKGEIVADDPSSGARSVTINLSAGDANSGLRRSALAALSRISGHDAETFNTLASLVIAGKEVPTAVAGIQRVVKHELPKEVDPKLITAIANQARKVPIDQRDTSSFRDLVALGASLARNGSGGDQVASELEALLIQSFTVKTIEAQMRFDVTRFYVEAGRPVRVELQNPDVMQHNLVITAPGAREEVGKQADSMGADGFKVSFVPKNDKVLFATKLVDPKKSEALTFAAPSQPADYDFVCTFPGHWLIMNGKMTVVPKGDPRIGKVETVASAAAQPRPGNF